MYEKYNELNTIIENLKNLSDRAHTINALTNSLTKEFVALNVKPLVESISSPLSIISELSTIIQSLSPELTLEHRVNICKNISESCFKNQVDLWQLICIIDNDALISNIAYVNNRFSQKAYSIFKEHMSNAKGYVYQSFNEMYDAVESGLCNCCIVPIENTIDGKLLSFYSIIERFDMKISLVCDVEAEDGSERTRYALLKYHILKPKNIYDTIYFEFNHTSSNDIEIAHIIEAAVLCGLTVSRIDSLPLIHNNSSFIMHTVVSGNSYDVLNYLVYLSVYIPQFNTIALYPIIK